MILFSGNVESESVPPQVRRAVEIFRRLLTSDLDSVSAYLRLAMDVTLMLLCWSWVAGCLLSAGGGEATDGGRSAALGTLREVFKVPGANSKKSGTSPGRGHWRKAGPAPEFMRALYEAVAHDRGPPLRGHVVRSYGERGNVTTSDVITFAISGLAATEEMVEAELHLYRIDTPVPLWDDDEISNETSPYYLIRVYQRLSAEHAFPLDSHRLLGVQHVAAASTTSSQQWQVVNVRAAVADWLGGRRPNLGFLVQVTTSNGRPGRVRFARGGREGRDPTLVLLFTSLEGSRAAEAKQRPSSVLRRHWRSVVGGIADRWIVPHNTTPEPLAVTEGSGDHCRLQDLWVDFNELGLDEWVIAPRGFNSGQCVGKCRLHGDAATSSNHATLLGALRRLRLPQTASRPACTPTALRSITTLTCHSGEDLQCTMRALEGLVAVGCKCQ